MLTASAAVQHTLEGYTLEPNPKYTTGNIKGWAEGQCIPFRYTLGNTGGTAESQTIQLKFDNINGAIIGIVDFESFIVPAGTIEGPYFTGSIGYYWWNVTIAGHTTYILEWCARLSNEAGLWPGASMQVYAENGGRKTVPILTIAIKMPDLYATKTATVSCDAISYTINYGNSGDANQINTVLVDDYDETKVTVTNTGGGTDNGSAITWDIGTLAAGASGSVTYTVIINTGVASGSEVINNGIIWGDLSEEVTADNSYSVTSYAKVSPVANFTSNSPQLFCTNITFTDTTTGGATPYTWYWDFGDGNTSTEHNPSYHYAAPGTYSVTLNVTDANGCTDSITKQVRVTAAPRIHIEKTASTSGTCPGSDPLTVHIGDNVTYCFNVSNTGDVCICNITVTDDVYGAVTLGTTTKLAPGESTTGTLSHIVTEADVPSVTNTALAHATGPLGQSVSDSDSCTINTDIAPAISIEKTASITGTCPGSDPLTVHIGDNVTYCFNVSNTGDVCICNITVTDDVYGAVTLGTTTKLAPGESTTGTLSHIVTEADVPSVTNTALAHATGPLGQSVSNSDSCTINTDIAPAISIEKTASITGTCPGSDPLTVHIGDNVTYCFNVSNTGDVCICNITVTDDVYGAVTLGTTTKLAPGESTTGTLSHIVTEADVPSVTNTALAHATGPLGQSVSDSDSCTINTDIAPAISIEKTASITGTCPGSDPLTVHIGDNVTYCFNVSNTGDVTLSNVTVTDNRYGTVTLGTTTLAPAESTTGTINHTVTESDVPSVTNTATAHGSDPLGRSITDKDSCTINTDILPGILITKTASLYGSCPGSDPLTVHIGDNVTYCFNVSNTGDVSLTNVSVTDNRYGAVTLGTKTLAPGESTTGTISHTVTESDVPSVTNTATAHGSDPLGRSITDMDPCTINTDILPGISITKTASLYGSCPGSDPLTVHIGDNVTYCFNVSNTGDVSLTNVSVTDNRYGAVTLGTKTLAPGESTTGTINHTVTESDVPSVTNTATAHGSDLLGRSITDMDSCTINTDILPGISITKTASLYGSCPGSDPLTVHIGDNVTYCFNVSNTGDVCICNITVTDDVYGAVTLGTTTKLAPGESTTGTLSHIVTEADVPSVTNTALAHATGPLGQSVSDSDSCTINTDIAPAISIEKTASITGTCPGSDPLTVHIGDNVTYCFNVSNTGDVCICNITVTDDVYGAVTLGTTTKLAPGESTTGTLSHIVTEADVPSVTNTALAHATGPLGQSVSDSDSCTINTDIAPAISIEKTASITGTCPGSDPLTVHIGDNVTYCFNVSNTGDVCICNITVTDDVYGAVTLGTTTKLAPGESTTGTLSHIVTEADVPSVTNTALAHATGPLGQSVSDSDSCTINTDIAPAISIEKTASITGTCPGSDPLTVHIGDNVTYCFNVSNTGDVCICNITVTDDVYGAVTLGTTTKLAPGESTTGTLSHIVTEADVPSVTNTALAHATGPLGQSVSDSDSCTINTDIAPAISIEKTASITGTCPGSDPLTVHIGDNVTYCFNVSNTGDVCICNITVTDDVYGAVTLGTTTKLAPGQSTTGTLSHIVTGADVPSVSNTALAHATGPLGQSVSDSDSCTINTDIASAISIEKTASITGTCPGSDPLTVHIGDNVTYCFNVSNTGDVSLTNVSVTDNRYGAVTLGTKTLAPGESTTGTINHTVTESDVPSVTNTATAHGSDLLGRSITDMDSCTINTDILPGISITKTASLYGSCPGSDPLTVHIGDNVTYCFNVSNTGDVSLTNVSVTDNRYGAVTLGTKTLAPGESTTGTISHTVTESDVPSVTNTATAHGSDLLGRSITDKDSCTINIDILPGISITKTASLYGSCPGSDPLTVHIGDNVTYCFNVSNTGDVSLTNVSVTDNRYGAVTLGTKTLAPGESTTSTINHTVTESDVPSVTNTATAHGSDLLGRSIADMDSCTINTDILPGISITKTASLYGSCPGSDPLTVHIGDNVTYCFNVSNTGDVSLTNVSVTDNRYGAVTLGTKTLAPGESTTGTISHTVTESDVPSVTNTATAHGSDLLGRSITDKDSCTINTDILPGISITKTASLYGSCPGSDPLTVHIGDNVTYCFNVSNTGDVSLTNVSVTDNRYGAVTLGTKTLAPGESTTGTINHTVTESDVPSVTNTATAHGSDLLGRSITDMDSCTINTDILPGISITKTASLYGSCPGSDPLTVHIGDNVTYCFNVSNTGDVCICNITVTDDVYGAVTLGTTTKLAPGESTTGTLSHIVTEADVPSVTNTALAHATGPLGQSVSDSDSCTINTDIAPAISIEKTASITGTCPGSDPLTVHIGDNVTYCFNVSNTGDVCICNITVTDDVYGAVTLGTTTKLAPGESTTGTLSHIVTEADVPSVTNTALAHATGPLGQSVSDSDSCTINTDIAPAISIEKTASITGTCPGSDPLTVHIGDNVTYCFNVSNTGDVCICNITVTDDVYGAVTLGTTTKLAPGESTTGTLSHIVTEADVPSVTNTALAHATGPLGQSVSDSDSCTINTDIAPAISIEKTASITGTCPGSDPLTVHIGDNVTYCFNVSNIGDVSLTNVSVTDNRYGAVTLGTKTLAPGESTTGTISHTVTESDVPSVTNTATAHGSDPLGRSITDMDPCTINIDILPGISITKTASLYGSCPGSDPLTVHIGDNVTYCFNVSNTGDVSLTNVSVTDNRYGAVTLGTKTLAPGESTTGTISHTVTESDVPSVTNTATAHGSDPLGRSITDMDPCTINTDILPGISITKTASLYGSCPGSDPLTVHIGDNVTYCFNVSNTGDVSLTNVSVTDNRYGAVTLGTKTLAPGESTTGTISHTVTESDVPSVTNTATAHGSDPLGRSITDKDPCTINTDILPGISITKTASLYGSCPGSDPLMVHIGDTVTYCYNVTNTGDVTLSNITVMDNRYGAIAIGSKTLAPGESTNGTATYVVTESDIPQVTNIATASGTDPIGDTITDSDDCTINVKIAPRIHINKTASTNGTCPGSDPLTVHIGDTITYCYNVTNTGDVTLTSVSVSDNIYGAVPLGSTTLAPGQSTSGTLTHIATESNIPLVTDIATAKGTDPLGDSITHSDDCTINVKAAPEVQIVKTASLAGVCPGSDPLTVQIGDNVTYCYNVTNTGDVTLINITVNDDRYGLVALSSTFLAPGQSSQGSLVYTVTERDVPSVINIATVNATDLLGYAVTNTDDCTINVETHPAIQVNKSASPTSGVPCTNVAFTITVTNTGDVTLDPVKVVDTLPAGMSYVDSSPKADEHDGTITWYNVSSLKPGESTIVKLIAHIDVGASGKMKNCVCVNATSLKRIVVHGCGCAFVTVTDVALEKTSSPSSVSPGGTINYTITYTNTGSVDLHDVVITEHYPDGVTFISASPAPDAGTNNVWTIGTLLPGESGTIVINVKVPEQIDLYFTETGSVIGEGLVMVTKDLSTEQKPYSLRNSVTLSCDELDPESAYATTKVSGVPGTSLGITESGSGLYSSDEILDLQTKNRTIILEKTTHAEYKPTSFNFSDSFSVNFTNKWKQDICSRNMEIGAAIHKKISDATYIDDETISRVDKDKSVMLFDSSFNGSLYIGARTNYTAISETYIGEFDVLQTIHIGKGPIPTPAPTPTPTWLPGQFNTSPEMNMTEDAEPTP